MTYYLSQSLATSTFKLYQTAYKSYSTFCYHTNNSPAPITEYKLMLYVTSSASHLSFKSIKTYLAGIQFQSIIMQCPVHINQMQQLYYLLWGIRRVQGNNYIRQPRHPITTTHLYQLRNFINLRITLHHDKLVYWAAVTLAFFGLLRSSEYTSTPTHSYNPNHTLLYNDITFAPNVSYVTINIRASKTDPFRTGCNFRVGVSHNQLCPFSALYHLQPQHIAHTGPSSFLTRTRLSALLTQCFNSTHINTHFALEGLLLWPQQDSQIQLL